MKKIIYTILVFLGSEIIVYLIGSFVNWNFNAGQWGECGRVIAGVFGTIISTFVASIASDNVE